MQNEHFQSAEIRLADAARLIANRREIELDKIKSGAKKWNEPDWIWESLLLSFGTMGNSRGAVLVHDPAIHSKVRFDTLRQVSSEERLTAIQSALRTAKVRMPSVKAKWLAENFERIVADGGPTSVQERLSACQGITEKLQFMRTFQGIGEKYARNILMDIYHPDFRNFIAVDVRIKSVSAKLGLTFNRYADEEEFYLRIACRAGLDGWTMDRVLYNFTPEIMAELDARSQPQDGCGIFAEQAAIADIAADHCN